MPPRSNIAFACRRLLRRPAFAILAVTTITLAVTAVAMPLTIARVVLRRAVPLPDPDRLVWIGETDGSVQNGTSFPRIRRLQQNARSFTAISAVTQREVTYSAGATSQRVAAAEVSPQFFAAAATPTRLGRGFTADEDAENGPPVVVISDSFWRTQLAARVNILGESIRLDGRSRAVIGVMPPGFDYPGETELWIPALQDLGAFATTENVHVVLGIGRLKPSASVASASAEMRRLSQLEQQPKSGNAGEFRLVARSLPEETTRDILPRLQVLIGAGIAMLLLGCANVANMLLTQTLARSGEMTVRIALGAGPRDILGLLVADVLVVLGAGAASGLILTVAITTTVARHTDLAFGSGLMASDAVHTLGWVFAIAVVAAFALTALTYAQIGRLRLGEALKGTRAGYAGGSLGRRLRSALVALQVAFTLVLCLGASALGTTYRQLASTRLGIQSNEVYTTHLARPDVVFTPDKRAAIRTFMTALVTGLSSAPGIRNVALATQAPATGNQMLATMVGASSSDTIQIGINGVSPNYFRTLGIPLELGRTFADRDDDDSVPVAIIDAQLAAHVFGSRAAVGRTISLPDMAMSPTVVGVVANVRQGGPASAGLPQVYLPYGALPLPWVTVLFQSRLPPIAATSLVASVIRRIDPHQPVEKLDLLGDLLRAKLDQSRAYAALLSVFAISAMLLTGIGLYGSLSLIVSQRTVEIGVRIALGAQRRDVVVMIMREAAISIVEGVVLGLGITLVSMRVLETILYGVSPLDWDVIMSSFVAVSVVAIAASVIPAFRAAGISPAIALRAE